MPVVGWGKHTILLRKSLVSWKIRIRESDTPKNQVGYPIQSNRHKKYRLYEKILIVKNWYDCTHQKSSMMKNSNQSDN